MSEHIVETFGIVQDFADLHGDMSTPLYQEIMNVMMSRQREPIVRCRDCDYYKEDRLGDFCSLLDFEDTRPMGDKFCAWGRRREDKEDSDG